MFCARCGEQIAEASEICPICGREATLRIEPPPPTPAPAPAQFTAPAFAIVTGPQGIGGWLLFYCLILTVFAPLVTLLQMAVMLRFLNAYYLIDVARVLYGLITGIVLWTKRPMALMLLRIYFIIIAATVALVALSLVAFALRTHKSVFLAQGFTPVLELAGFSLLWFAYFRKSVRVRNTYGANL